MYGTFIGAGVVSVVATCGGTVFQHLFKRTGEQLREVTVQAKAGARQVPVVSPYKRGRGTTPRSPAGRADRTRLPMSTPNGRARQVTDAAAPNCSGRSTRPSC